MSEPRSTALQPPEEQPPGPDGQPAPGPDEQPDQRRPVPLLRNRDFQALWSGEAFAAIGKETAEIAYPLLILATTGSAFYAGIVGSVQLLTASLLSIVGGNLADRIDRRFVLLACNLIRVALLSVLGLLVLTDHAYVVAIFAVAVGSSVCLGVWNPAALAAIKQLVPPQQLTQATSQNQIRYFGATMVGPPIGGSLFGIARAFPFLAAALSFLISALLLLVIKKPMQESIPADGERRRTIEGFRFLARQPVLRLLMVWILGSNMAFTHTGIYLAVIATANDRGASESFIGMVLAIAGMGGLAGALVAGWVLKRVRPPAIFLAGAWIGPVAAVLLATVPGVIPLGIIVACVFVRGPITSALFLAYLAALAPDKLQGRVLGAVMFMSMIAAPIGVFGVGAIFDLAGSTAVFTVVGVIATLAALPTLSRRVRTLARPEEMAV